MNNATLIDNDRQQDHGDWFGRGRGLSYSRHPILEEITGYKGETDSQIFQNPF